MMLSPSIRRKLLLRLIDAATMITLTFLLLAVFPSIAWKPMVADALEILILLGVRILVSRNVPATEHILLAVILGTITCFDDGFRGAQIIWILHIPIALTIWILIESVTGRTFWLTMQAASIVLVNHTPFSPHLGRDTISPMATWESHIYMGMATLASLLVVRFLSQLQHSALLEAQDQKRQAESASRTKDEFLSHMSHELRTPLNSIQGFSDISLQNPEIPPELEENLRAIRQSADHLTHLVNDLLDLARLENGTVVLAHGGFSPDICIEETLALLRPQAREKALELVCDGPMTIPRVMGDRVRWKQILLNLIGNAIKYTPAGHVKIKAIWTDTGPENGSLVVVVTDTGIGIEPQDQPKVFDRFHRLGGFAAPSGTGLGLPISSILAKAMGGSISLQSRAGKGSTFSLEVPFSVAGTDPSSQTSLSLAPPPNLSGHRILLAEDNRLNIRLATQVLRQLQAQFDVAEDGGKALELLRMHHYDLLLLDLHMPVKNGFEVARSIRDPRSDILDKDIPILALTADAFEETRQRTVQAGMDDFLSKPFRIVDLADRILRLVKNRPRESGTWTLNP